MLLERWIAVVMTKMSSVVRLPYLNSNCDLQSLPFASAQSRSLFLNIVANIFPITGSCVSPIVAGAFSVTFLWCWFD